MQIGNNEKLHLSFYIHKLSLGSKADEEVSDFQIVCICARVNKSSRSLPFLNVTKN